MQERKITLRIIKHPMPPGVHGMSMKEADTILVFINESDDSDTQKKAFIHECLHIWHGDHDREDVNVQQLEAEQHAETRKERWKDGKEEERRSIPQRDAEKD